MSNCSFRLKCQRPVVEAAAAEFDSKYAAEITRL